MLDLPRSAPAKFRPRPLSPNQLERTPLLELLERHAEAKLVLIHAPAGYGKTTLMAQWCQRRRDQGDGIGWIWLDDDDNDAGRLGGILSQALVPDGAGRIDLFDAINRCLDSVPHFTLFLDEEEHLTAQDAVHLLTVLLDFSPPELRLVIGSRSVPPELALRLRLRADYLAIGARDLAFRREEIAAFMQSRAGSVPDAETLATLETVTEGWAAALQLAAVEIAQGVPPAQIRAHLSGPHSDVFRYLTEEMLVHLQPSQREFLVRTSFLQELSGPLCDAVTGRDDGERQLEELHRANLLLQPVDAARRSYRYHALLAGLLRRQLREQHAAELPQLARRASQWCTREQLDQSATEYALLSGDADLLLECVQRCIGSLIAHAQFATARRWLDAIHPELLDRHTDLLIWSAWVDIWTNDFAAAEARVAAISRATQPLSAEQRLMHTILEVLLSLLHERYDKALTALQAVRLPAQPPHPIGREISVRLENLSALLAQIQGRFGEATRHCDRAFALATQAPPIWLSTVHAAHISAMVELSLGNLDGAMRQLKLPERLLSAADAAEATLDPGSLRATLCGTQALVLYEKNRLADAEDCLDRHGPFLGAVFSPSSRALWYQLRARLSALRGNEDGYFAIISEANAYAVRHRLEWMQRLIQWERIDHDLAQGDINHAHSLADGLLDPLTLSVAPEWISTCQEVFGPTITALRFLIRSDQPQRALEHLPLHIAQAERQLRRLRMTRLLLLQSLALQATERRVEALATLRQALELGRQSGAIRIFLDEGAPCLALLRELEPASRGARERSGSYIHELLAGFEGAEGGDGAPDVSVATAEPLAAPRLSAREAQILQRLSQGYSNLAVGQQLFLSPNTIKWHLRQIYSKLQVRNRTQAVHIARQLNLVP